MKYNVIYECLLCGMEYSTAEDKFEANSENEFLREVDKHLRDVKNGEQAIHVCKTGDYGISRIIGFGKLTEEDSNETDSSI